MAHGGAERPAFWVLHDSYGTDYENTIGSYRMILRDTGIQSELQYCDGVQDSYGDERSEAGYITITFCESASKDAYMEGLILGFEDKEHIKEMMNRLADCILNHKQVLDGRGLDFIIMIME